MRSTDERMALLKKRTAEIEKKHKNKRAKLIKISSSAPCTVLVIAISNFIAYNMELKDLGHIPASGTASLFTGGYFLGYTVIGILAFLLGVCVTVLCSMLHKKNKEEDDVGGTDR